jgi:hypothetical protein
VVVAPPPPPVVVVQERPRKTQPSVKRSEAPAQASPKTSRRAGSDSGKRSVALPARIARPASGDSDHLLLAGGLLLLVLALSEALVLGLSVRSLRVNA